MGRKKTPPGGNPGARARPLKRPGRNPEDLSEDPQFGRPDLVMLLPLVHYSSTPFS